MSWNSQFVRVGYYRLNVWKFLDSWTYDVWWDSGTATTTIGKGSEKYSDLFEARYAAVLHLSSILPKPQAERLLSTQAELAWVPYNEPHKHQ